MLRFLTDELQDAEDAGDRGGQNHLCGGPILNVCSLDFGARPQRLGRFESVVEPY